MREYRQPQIESIVNGFVRRTLPIAQWTHEAHMIIAIWHHTQFDFFTALDLVQTRIRKYNEAVGTLNTDDSGYHETLTIFWMIVLKNFLVEYSEKNITNQVNEFLNSGLQHKDTYLRYYTKDLLHSKLARKKWCNGDVNVIQLKHGNGDHHLNLTDEEFIGAFQNCSMSPSLFSHGAHLRLAWIHSHDNDAEIAVDLVCQDILRFVEHVGAKDKFHKTLTVVATRMVHHFMKRSRATDFFDFLMENIQLSTKFKELISSHYGFDIYNSPKAKQEYLKPDLVPFWHE